MIRGRPAGGPPPEKVLSLAGIVAPRLGRRPNAGQDAEPSEPFAWEAREYLRGKLVGKEVSFVIEYTVPVREPLIIHSLNHTSRFPALGGEFAFTHTHECSMRMRCGKALAPLRTHVRTHAAIALGRLDLRLLLSGTQQPTNTVTRHSSKLIVSTPSHCPCCDL